MYIQTYSFACYFMCVCETWCVTLREEHKLRVFENRVLRKAFGLEWEEVTEDWRELHNEELHDWYCSSNIIRMNKEDEMGSACCMYWGKE